MRGEPHRVARPDGHLSGGDANPHAQPELLDRLDDLQTRLHGLRARLLVGDGKAEEAHVAITLGIVGDAAMADDDAGAALVVAREDLAVALDTQRGEQPGGLRQVVGHDGQLAQVIDLAAGASRLLRTDHV